MTVNELAVIREIEMSLDFHKVHGNVVWVRAKGILTDEDYADFVPRMEELIKQWGRLRMLFEMEDFHGWDAHSAWEEFKFHVRNHKNLKRVAVVGEKAWEKWASRISRFFTGSDVKFFDRADLEKAREWIEVGW